MWFLRTDVLITFDPFFGLKMTIFEMTILDDINYSDFSADNKNRRNQDQV